MTTVNPAHRIDVRTGDELEALAQDINRLADHLRDARSVLEGPADGPAPARRPRRRSDPGAPFVGRSVFDTEPRREHRLDELTFVVVDVETTGLRPDAGDRIVSLAGVRVRAGIVRAGETFDSLVCPERPIPAASTCVHGITDAMVANAPMIADVLPAFLRFAAGAVLVGHEASFDMAFLRRDIERLGLVALAAGHPVLDTRLLSRVVHGPGPEHTLEAVAERLGVKVIGRHSALGDALTTAEIFVRLLPLLNRRGLVTLGAAVDAVRRGLTRSDVTRRMTAA